MRLLKFGRFILLCILAVFVWAKPSLLRAQYGGGCATFNTYQVCCTDGNAYDCEKENCMNVTDGPTGDGGDTAMFENLNCITEPGGPKGACPSQNDYLVPVHDPGCYCQNDGDCPDGYYCGPEFFCIPDE